jgi:hypothetical protein
MESYQSDDIYGVKIYKIVDGIGTMLFRKKGDEIISEEIKKEAKLCYDELNETHKNDVVFKICIKCETTDCYEGAMCWIPITLDVFLERFGV